MSFLPSGVPGSPPPDSRRSVLLTLWTGSPPQSCGRATGGGAKPNRSVRESSRPPYSVPRSLKESPVWGMTIGVSHPSTSAAQAANRPRCGRGKRVQAFLNLLSLVYPAASPFVRLGRLGVKGAPVPSTAGKLCRFSRPRPVRVPTSPEGLERVPLEQQYSCNVTILHHMRP